MRFTKMVAVLAVGIGLFVAGNALADGTTITVTVPFSFTVGKTTVPAGRYEFKEADGDTVVMDSLTSPEVHVMVPVVSRIASGREADAHLVFGKVDGKAALTQVWIGDMDGFQVPTAAESH